MFWLRNKKKKKKKNIFPNAWFLQVNTHDPCDFILHLVRMVLGHKQGAQWLSGRVLDSRPKGRGFEPHRRHCVVVLEQDTFILA